MWFGLVSGEMQFFDQGKITVLNPKLSAAPLKLGAALIVPAGSTLRYSIEEQDPVTLFVLGLKPNTAFSVVVRDDDIRQASSDSAGTLELEFKEPVTADVLIAPLK
jgi:hypothetical protein